MGKINYYPIENPIFWSDFTMKISRTLNKITHFFSKSSNLSQTPKKRDLCKPLIPAKGMRIYEVVVAGTQHKGRVEIAQQLTLQEPLRIQRDLKNIHDKNAIYILNSKGQVLGYLPRRYAKILAPHLDRGTLNIASRIVRLEQGPAENIHTIHVAICLPDQIIESASSPQLEYTCDRGGHGALYILLNCESVILNEIETALAERDIAHNRNGPCIQNGSDGHEYNWFIRLSDNVTEGQIHLFFKELYELQPWNSGQSENILEYVDTFDTEIETKEHEISRLEESLIQSNSRLKRVENEHKKEVDKTRKNTIQKLLPNVELIRDSWDVLLWELQNPESVFQILQKIQVMPETLHAKRVRSTKNWKELHYGTGQSNDGRLYFKRKGQAAEVLISFKQEQKEDINWIQKNP